MVKRRLFLCCLLATIFCSTASDGATRSKRSTQKSAPLFQQYQNRKRDTETTDKVTDDAMKYQGCTLEDGQLVFPLLPGLGYDVLRDVELGRVLHLNYSYCYLSKDRKYLIPNDVEATPVKVGYLEETSEHKSSYKEMKSSTSESLTVSVNAFGFGASYSTESRELREEQESTKCEMEQISSKHRRYSITFQPGAQLHPEFLRRLREIGEELIVNSKRAPYADYLSEMIVAEFGTHYIVSYEVGGLLTQTNFVTSALQNSASEESKTKKGGVSTPYFSISGGKGSSKSSKSNDTSTANQIFMNIYGGPVYGPHTKPVDWQHQLENHLVAVDKRGESITALVTPDILPEFSEQSVYLIRHSIERAIQRYVSANKRSGCMDVFHPKYDRSANVDDTSKCGATPLGDVTFLGGVFHKTQASYSAKTSHFKNADSANHLTGTYSCPKDFSEVKLYEDASTDSCYHREGHSSATMNVFVYCTQLILNWCKPNKQLTEGFLFGGTYNHAENIPNEITLSNSCPLGHEEWDFGYSAKICLISSTQDTNDVVYLNFGGFYSCKSPNPLNHNEYGCPSGFRDKPVFTIGECTVFYCADRGPLLQAQLKPRDRIRLPPFTDLDVNAYSRSLFNAAEGKVSDWVRVGNKWTIRKDNQSRSNIGEEFFFAQLKRDLSTLQ